MLAFGFIVIYVKFIGPLFNLPIPELEIEFWDLLKIGISEFKVYSKEIVEKVNDNNTLVGFSDQSEKSFADFYFLSERETDVLYFLIKGLCKVRKTTADKPPYQHYKIAMIL